MSKSIEGAESEFFGSFRKLVTVIDKLRDAGLHEHISLPRIAVLGSQSAGKSSLLEAIVGMNFLPRGSGIVTRRPLELRLEHIPNINAIPYGIFEAQGPKKFYHFDDIRKNIEKLTDKECGRGKKIINNPIVLVIYSPSCPDLTIIDLPGITRISIGDQDENVEKVTKEMATYYCQDERTIILCVVPANQDMSNSDGLQLARRLDPEGIRTIGVITKIDIMDRGTNAKDMLLNKVIPLKLGFVGCKGRAQADIDAGMTVKDGVDAEKRYFSTHKVYSNLPRGYTGTQSLVKKLTTVMYKHIRRVMPSIVREIDTKIAECESQAKDLGEPLPVDQRDKLMLLWKLISKFVTKVQMSVNGEYNQYSTQTKKNNLLGGPRINLKFNELLLQYTNANYSASKRISDKDIKRAIRMHTGASLPGFTSADSFLSLINPLLEKLREPCLGLITEVHAILEQVIIFFANEVFMRLPQFASEIVESSLNVILEDKEKTYIFVTQLIDSYLGFTYTKDPSYIKAIYESKDKFKIEERKKKQEAIEKKRDEEAKQRKIKVEKGKEGVTTIEEEAKMEVSTTTTDQTIEEKVDEDEIKERKRAAKKKTQSQNENALVYDMRIRLDTYFRVATNQLADLIPKLIGFNMIKSSMSSLQFKVYQTVTTSSTFENLSEPEHIVTRRNTISKTLSILKDSRKILLRDPDLAYHIGRGGNSEYDALTLKEKQKKKDSKDKKASMMKNINNKIKSGYKSVKKVFTNTSSKEHNSTIITAQRTSTNSSTRIRAQRASNSNVHIKSQHKQVPKDPSVFDDMRTAARLTNKYKDKIPVQKIAKTVQNNPEMTKKVLKAATKEEKKSRKGGFGSLFG